MVRAFLIGSFFLAASCFGQVRNVPHSGDIGAGVGVGLHNGGYGYGGGNRGGRGGYGRGGYVYAYPAYIGGYGGYYGDYGSGYAPNYPPPGYVDPSLLQGPGPGAAPPVVINQYFGVPPMVGPPDPSQDQNIHMYQQQSGPAGYAPAPAASDARSYLIAYKDHSVYTALAYWVEGHTLHYVTTANTHNQADLDLIDVDFTKKLNADRSMPFNVPGSY